MHRAILVHESGSTQSFPLSKHDAEYFVDDGKVYKPIKKRYDSVMGGYWVTFLPKPHDPF